MTTDQKQPTLNTVTGMVALSQIETADSHGHVWITPPEGVRPKHQFWLNQEKSIITELKRFRDAGGNLIVDCQPGECGRNGRQLQKLSEETTVFITATTGFHLEQYYQPEHWLWQSDEHHAADYFLRELTIGLRETDDAVQATTIKVGYTGYIEGQSRTLMEGVAEAARKTGALVLCHTEEGRNIEALLPFFDDRGVSPTRLYLCHVDKRPDVGLHRELAQAGCLLGYDTFIRSTYKPRENALPLLKEMVQGGLYRHIAIGLDMARSSYWHEYGGQPGLAYLPQELLPRLFDVVQDEAIIKAITGQNIARYLAVHLA